MSVGAYTLKPRARFVLRKDPGTSFEVDKEDFLLGRSKDCDVLINDPYVSRRHAKVRFENGSCHGITEVDFTFDNVQFKERERRMNVKKERVTTALLTIAIGGLLFLGGLQFLLAQRVSVLEETVIGLTKDQISNMKRFQALENTVYGKTVMPPE